MTAGFFYALIGLVLGHLLADFFFQKTAWVKARKAKKWRSPSLYLHGLIAGTLPVVLAVLMGWLMTWLIPSVSLTQVRWYEWLGLGAGLVVAHTVIDLIKTYLPDKPFYFIADQLMHGLCLLIAALVAHPAEINTFKTMVGQAASPKAFGLLIISIVLTKPCSFLVQNLVSTLGYQADPENSLYKGGELIGMLERQMIFICIMTGQPAAIGWMLGAKSILRFNEIRQSVQTEYLLVGTLGSTMAAVVCSLIGVKLFF